MSNKRVNYVFFSPTATTRTTIQAVAHGTGGTPGRILDLTCGIPDKAIQFTEKDLVIVGMPVYGSRLPALAVERFKVIRGSNTPVIPIVVYGNRAYGDALLELSELCVAQGFHTVAAGTFIGEHSFSSVELPIAANRPDAKDLQRAEQFGSQITDLLDSCESLTQLGTPDIPGNHPYKPLGQRAGAATDVNPQICTSCGKCIELCPTQAISMINDLPETDPDNCIWCMACLRNCPAGARRIALPKINAIAERLYGACQERREPEIFLA